MSDLTFHETTLANGLRIIGEHNPQAQSFAAAYFVNTGARDESPEVAGVSHFLEHMMFKGSARRSAEDINREFDELGANNNAYTSEEQTVYYGAVVAERGAALLDLLTDMMRPALRQSDFDIEKNVILEEIAMYDDRPNFQVFDLGNEKFYAGHPLGNSILGTRASIAALEAEQMRRYFKARYAPNNMLLSVTGNYDWAAVRAQVERDTRAWQRQDTARSYPEFQPNEGGETVQDEALKRAHVALFAPGVSWQNELRYAAAVLATCVGDGTGSRLYWALVDGGLADSASLSHNSADGVGAFVGYLSTAPETLQSVRARYLEVLKEVETDGLDEDEWLRAQRKLATSITLRGETPAGRLMSLGSTYLYTGQYETVQEVVARVFATTLDEAKALLAERPFSHLYALSLSS